ncbi:MAG TPA: SDR family oxidoreductase [Candidatus Deferrimicrobium sp.]|nr:SDR family oxidoreductase [Candidatus Deferrimicrobium sp.]
MPELKNSITLISGASSGIGEACAKKFADKGARLILVARRLERLQKLRRDLQADAHVIQLDVRDRRAVETAMESLPPDWKAIDVLINNAGLSRGLDKLHEGSIDDWEEMVDTNVKGLLYLSRAIIPGMVARGKGHIINIGSIAGLEVYPRGNVYCATKHAVDALTKGMRIDLVDTPVRVSSVDPGLVETEFSQVRFHGDLDRAKKVYQGYQPLTPDDVAEAVVWVAERPQHVQVAHMLIFPKAQASAMIVHKKP